MSTSRNVRDHYESLLAQVYSWMAGGTAAALDSSRAFFRRYDISPGATPDPARALDLGAGSGFQSIPLAERGFRVTAVDLSPALLSELRASAGGLPIEVVEASVPPLAGLIAEQIALVVCMGDTLSHLSDVEEARQLIAESAEQLADGGQLVLTWRDLTTLPRGDARFLNVRSDEDAILTCFLEAVDERTVRVHDLLHRRAGQASDARRPFELRVSSYDKLRLGVAEVDEWIADAGLRVEVATVERGMATRIARKGRR